MIFTHMPRKKFLYAQNILRLKNLLQQYKVFTKKYIYLFFAIKHHLFSCNLSVIDIAYIYYIYMLCILCII